MFALQRLVLLAAETVAPAGEAAEKGKPFHTPEAGHLFNYKVLFELGPFKVTFPMIVLAVVTLLLITFFVTAFRNAKAVPTGAQNVGEAGIDFVKSQIVLPVLGPNGVTWLPFLTAMFFWVFFLNITGIIPGIQFPITSRMAVPATLAIIVWVVYNYIGIKSQGPIGYFKGIMFPPGVPKPIYILLAPIEFISTILVRPLTLAVRLFANMVAGHMILAVLAVGSAVFFASGMGKVFFVLPFAFGTIMTGFEIFVAGMQAFIITILTSVYIAGAQEAHH
jgi:F-type H+-transporting ATPase subunit a